MSDAPIPEDSKKYTDDLATAIWQSGWKAGNKKGYSDGYNNGKSVMSSGWAVFALLVYFGVGAWVGYAADWVHTCEPILVTDVKSCTKAMGG
jgi:hypothetical protein